MLKILPKTFVYNGLGEQPTSKNRELGIIAQDVEKVAPQIVSTRDVKLHSQDQQTTTVKQVNYTSLIYIVINAVKELYKLWVDDSHSVHQELTQLRSEIQEKNQRIKNLELKNMSVLNYLCRKDPAAEFCGQSY